MAQIESISQMFAVFCEVCERPVIKTSFDNPPIPTRRFDWAAWYDDLGEDGSPIGQGVTEQEAIDDLIAMGSSVTRPTSQPRRRNDGNRHVAVVACGNLHDRNRTDSIAADRQRS